MGIATQIGFEAAGSLSRSGLLVHSAIQGVCDGIRINRERAVDSVQELALRLQEARRDQRAAERRAAVAEKELGGALAELRLLREALRHEKALTARLCEAIGV